MSTGRMLGGVCGVWFYSAAALAQDEPSALVTSATALQQASEHDAARVLLEQAYARAPSARIAGQLAISELALSRFRDAETHFTEALRSSVDPWVLAHRDDLVDGLARAAATLGTIDTSQVPPGTEVRFEGRGVGYAPAPIRWPAGPVNLELVSPLGTVTAHLELVAGATVVLSAPPFQSTESPVTAAPAPSRASALRFSDAFRARFAPRGAARDSLERTPWLEPEWATTTNFVLVGRVGFGLADQSDGMLEYYRDPCEATSLSVTPRFALGAGVHQGIGFPVVFTTHAFVAFEPHVACEVEALPGDPDFSAVTRYGDGWSIGLLVDASFRLTPRRTWYLGVGGEIGAGLFAYGETAEWTGIYPRGNEVTEGSEAAGLFLWRGFVEAGGSFGADHDFSVGVRLGGGMPTLFSADVQLVVPLVGL